MPNEAECEDRELGWIRLPVPAERVAKRVAHANAAEVVELRSGERMYLPDVPALSREEGAFVAELVHAFQSQAGPGVVPNPYAFVKAYCAERLVLADDAQKKYWVRLVDDHAHNAGVLSGLLDDPALEEIAVAGTGRLCPVRVFHREFGWLSTPLCFDSSKSLVNLINRLARLQPERLTLQSPRLNARLPNGDRLHAALSPVAVDGVSLTIRRFSKTPIGFPQLVKWNTLSSEAVSFLARAMRVDSNVAVVGNTGSGKTTTLGALLHLVPPSERLVLLEETPEVRLLHAHAVRLVPTPAAGICLQDLVGDSLRMRPDRLVVGEIRYAAEATAFVDTLLAGQGKGSVCTFHAQSAREALQRLARMGISEMDLGALDVIVVQRRWNRLNPDASMGSEIRRVTEICEVLIENNGYSLNPVFAFDPLFDRLIKVGESQKIDERFAVALGTGFSEAGDAWIERERFLLSLLGRGLGAQAFFDEWHAGVEADRAGETPDEKIVAGSEWNNANRGETRKHGEFPK